MTPKGLVRGRGEGSRLQGQHKCQEWKLSPSLGPPLRVCLSQASAQPGLASRPSENGRRSPSNSSLSEGKADPVTYSAGEGVGGVKVGAALRRGLLAPAPTWPAEADTSEPWELGLLAAGASPPPSSQPGADGSVCPSSTLSSVCSRLGVGARKEMTNSAILPSSQGCVCRSGGGPAACLPRGQALGTQT